MYNKDTQQDWIGSALSGAIGGGIVTSCAVFQGQPLSIALPITMMSAAFAILCHKFELI